MFYSADDSTTVNTVEQDVENDLKIIVIPKRVWKMYDAYCYSALTDHLDVYDKTEFIPLGREFRSHLKIKSILSFKEYRSVETFRGSDIGKKVAEDGYTLDCRPCPFTFDFKEKRSFQTLKIYKEKVYMMNVSTHGHSRLQEKFDKFFWFIIGFLPIIFGCA